MSHVITTEFALLAPVPAEHIEAADAIRGQPYVAFGSNAFEVFREIDDLRRGKPVPVFLYPSHDDEPGKPHFTVTWRG
jgi:hypothetical protein